jgi:hypothetical protein
MKRGYRKQSLCVNIWKVCMSYPVENELYRFPNFHHSEPSVAKMLPPYISQLDQFHCKGAKCIVKPPSAWIANSVFFTVICRLDVEVDDFIHAPSFSFNEVKRVLENGILRHWISMIGD